MAGSVQFMGKEQVFDAFDNRGVDAWAIFQGKQFIHKGIGGEDLSSFLDMLKAGGSNATYTLKIFEDITQLSQIKEKTECDGSYNFKINGPNEGGAINGSYTRANDEILKRLDAIEQRQLSILEEEEEEPETIGSVIIDVIKNPNKAMQWFEIVKGIFTNNNQQPTQGPAIVRQIPPAASMGNPDPGNSDENLTRLEKALDTLGANDPKIIEHLEKLADISAKKPGVFKTLLSMLETM